MLVMLVEPRPTPPTPVSTVTAVWLLNGIVTVLMSVVSSYTQTTNTPLSDKEQDGLDMSDNAELSL